MMDTFYGPTQAEADAAFAAAVSLLPVTPECRRLAGIIHRWQRALLGAKK